MNLEDLNAADFESCLDQKFTILVEGADPIETQLIEVRGLAPPDEDEDRRPPFSLVFRGPEDQALEQGISTVENETLGKLDLFVVTIGPDGKGMRHEVVFT